MRRSHRNLILPLATLALTIVVGDALAAKNGYVCTARIDCGAPRLPSTQDLPSSGNPVVRSNSLENAKAKCMARYTRSYLRLARSLASSDSLFKETKSCEIKSDALRL